MIAFPSLLSFWNRTHCTLHHWIWHHLYFSHSAAQIVDFRTSMTFILINLVTRFVCIALPNYLNIIPLLSTTPVTPHPRPFFYPRLHVVQEYRRGVKEGLCAVQQWIRGVHTERGEMLTQLCPARYCWRFPSILCLLNRAPVRCFLGVGGGSVRIMRSVITPKIHACMWNGCVAPLVHNSRTLIGW